MRTLFVLTLLLAQAAAPPPQSQPPPVTFKVEVNYVEIDASVTDAEGNFVRNLTKDDFQVVEDGKKQTLTAFSMVDIPIARPDPPLYSKTAITPDVVSNKDPFDGRVFVIVLDDLHTGFSRTPRVRAAARDFVERYVGANDMVAVLNTSGVSNGMQDFTANRALAVRAIDAAMGRKEGSSTAAALEDYYINRDLPGMQTDMNQSFNEMMRFNNARNSLRRLKGLADFMAAMRGRRKAIVVFSEGINYDVADPFNNPHATDMQHELHDLIAAATRDNVSFYTIDPRGVTNGMEDAIELSAAPADRVTSTSLMDEMRLEHNTLRTIAEETGGIAVLNQNDYRNAFSRILADSSSYYVLGYYPTNDKRDGKFRNVQVRLAGKPGLKVRTRRGYNAPVAAKKENAAKGTAAERTSPELLDALESPVPVSGLTLSAFAAPFKGEGNTDTVAFSVEVDASVMKFAPLPDGRYANDLEVTLYAIDAGTSKVADGSRDVVGVVLRPQVTEMRSPFRVVRALKVPPGRYQLRIGAKESGGKVGVVIYDLEAPDFSKGPIAMSGLALSSAALLRVPTAQPTGGPDMKALLPAPPTATRDFLRSDELSTFVEIYDNLGTTPSHRVVITTTVVADDGKTVFTASDERRSEELSGTGGGFGHTAKIPLTNFAPGRYVLRVEAKPTLGNAAPVSREVEFTVQ